MMLITRSKRYLVATALFLGFLLTGLATLSESVGAFEDDPRRVSSQHVATLRQLVGQQVTVYGEIARVGQSKSGHQFLNFDNSQLAVFCSSGDVKKFGDEPPSKLYLHQQIEVSGKLELFKGKPQIQVRSPSQIRIVAALPKGKSEQAVKRQGVKLTKIGQDAWLSPAGLVYRGRDPSGLTRIEHICRHVEDIPNRDGPHGVFDGDRDVAFGVIDEAWKIAQARKMRPVKEGSRSTYTVAMGRPIGYLGGRTGAAKRKPRLSRIFIVFETGTKNIITAFPK